MRWAGRVMPYLGVLLVVLGGIALALGGFAAPDSRFDLLLSLGIALGTVGILTMIFGLLLPLFLRASPPTQAVIDAAALQGRTAIARVLGVRPTGVKVGNTWEFALELVVASTDRPAYRSIQFVRGAPNPQAFSTDELVTVVRIAQDDPRVVLVRDAATTDQSAQVPETADSWS